MIDSGKKIKKIGAVCSVIVGLILVLGTGIPALFVSPADETDSSTINAGNGIVPEANAAENVPSVHSPVKLIIPAITLDAVIQHVGTNKKGNMAVPTNFTDVGWYKYGPAPGESGNAVIAGHYDNGLGTAAVFKNLRELKIADNIQVEDAQGISRTFDVVSVDSYPLSTVPLDEIFSKDGAAMLVLITCDGEWVQSEKTYDHRIVVKARLSR